jgi:hypothetical protein
VRSLKLLVVVVGICTFGNKKKLLNCGKQKRAANNDEIKFRLNCIKQGTAVVTNIAAGLTGYRPQFDSRAGFQEWAYKLYVLTTGQVDGNDKVGAIVTLTGIYRALLTETVEINSIICA